MSLLILAMSVRMIAPQCEGWYERCEPETICHLCCLPSSTPIGVIGAIGANGATLAGLLWSGPRRPSAGAFLRVQPEAAGRQGGRPTGRSNERGAFLRRQNARQPRRIIWPHAAAASAPRKCKSDLVWPDAEPVELGRFRDWRLEGRFRRGVSGRSCKGVWRCCWRRRAARCGPRQMGDEGLAWCFGNASGEGRVAARFGLPPPSIASGTWHTIRP